MSADLKMKIQRARGTVQDQTRNLGHPIMNIISMRTVSLTHIIILLQLLKMTIL